MKTTFKDTKQQRVYIRNFVDRYYTGSKKCVNCGKEPTTIIHNEKDPYKISFICDTCRLGVDREDLENLSKINILEHIELNKKFSHSKNLVLDEHLRSVLENALTTKLSLMEYIKDNKISYKRFKKAIDKYDSEIKPIKKELNEHFKQLRNEKISISKKSNLD